MISFVRSVLTAVISFVRSVLTAVISFVTAVISFVRSVLTAVISVLRSVLKLFSISFSTTVSDAMPPAHWNIASIKPAGARDCAGATSGGATMPFFAARACWAESKVDPAQPKAI